jgi:hypothetical protein
MDRKNNTAMWILISIPIVLIVCCCSSLMALTIFQSEKENNSFEKAKESATEIVRKLSSSNGTWYYEEHVGLLCYKEIYTAIHPKPSIAISNTLSSDCAYDLSNNSNFDWPNYQKEIENIEWIEQKTGFYEMLKTYDLLGRVTYTDGSKIYIHIVFSGDPASPTTPKTLYLIQPV